ncbi:hypothetical protein E4P41_16120 [Geodermatophilus sp. DF01-2]|uniref:hypothetical protein n=1 Tax=Geodermatophilus sp. DF01-2 TaxID=2559610 RepID=UPI0010730EB1|nr:hypothetical protein [Geodermatophilus sp. DF01_2]TFV56167.1 hypothetical protein E4P41_16120 [Geodermatophilus sp. DF01_2]
MRRISHRRLRRGSITAAVVAVVALGPSACAEDTAEPETGVEDATGEEIVEDALEAEQAGPLGGPYDSAFLEELRSAAGDDVVVSAEVDEILSPSAFTIAGTDDTAVEPLLVIGATEFADLEPGVPVQVAGTVQLAFDVAAAEEAVGVDLDDALFEGLAAEPYLVADDVDVLPSAGG